MTLEKVVASLDLPPEAMVEQRVPKKLIIENGAPTAADKRYINDGIEELFWIAALKPNTIGVPEYRDAEREILEIAVLSLNLRPGAKASRIIELVHRAIPYPLFLVSQQQSKIVLSLATIRWSQNEGAKTVLEDQPLQIELADDSIAESFLLSVSLRKQSREDLQVLYLRWIALFEAFKASAYTGVFKQSTSTADIEKRQQALELAESLETELVNLRTKATRETQMNRRVELNMRIKELEAQLAQARQAMA